MTGTSPDNDARRAGDEAVQWVILLREEPGDLDVRARFDAWLAASPLNARAWAATAHAYDRAGDTRPRYSAPVRAAETRPVLPSGPVPYRLRHDIPAKASPRLARARALVASAAAAVLVYFAAPTVMLHIKADHQTGTAELANVPLADGSLARLAPNSAIAVTYAANRRQIRLLKGEAWFEVRHDSARPFYVDADGVTTTDLGTTFDVRLDAKGVTTAVASGLVHVAYSRAAPPVSEQLSAGQTVRVTFDGLAKRETQEPSQIAAWRNRQIVVRDRPASEVIDALRPWFSGIIVVRGDGFARQRVTGVYNAADPVEALTGLTQAYGGSVTTVSPWVIVLSSR